MSYGFREPAAWWGLPENERESRSELSSDQCIIDGRYFFLKGLIEIPVVDAIDRFNWTVWVSVSEASFRRASELWRQAGRETGSAFFGWMNTALPIYPDTINLKTMVHMQPVGHRPVIELEPTNHPLAVEQREGITLRRVREIAETISHLP
jgi:hypothetical protein